MSSPWAVRVTIGGWWNSPLGGWLAELVEPRPMGASWTPITVDVWEHAPSWRIITGGVDVVAGGVVWIVGVKCVAGGDIFACAMGNR